MENTEPKSLPGENNMGINTNKQQINISISKNEKQKTQKKKKKVKRKKSAEKCLQNMEIYFNNVRGLKTKWDSIQEIISENKPDIVGLVETHLEKKEVIGEIDGYTIIRSERTEKEGGGILVALKNKYKNVCVEKETRETKHLEQVWLHIGGKTKYKVGTVYLPQGEKLLK